MNNENILQAICEILNKNDASFVGEMTECEVEYLLLLIINQWNSYKHSATSEKFKLTHTNSPTSGFSHGFI